MVFWLLVVCSLMTAVPARAQNSCLVQVFGTKYEIFEIGYVANLPSMMFALSNVVDYPNGGFGGGVISTATTVGTISGSYPLGIAGGYAPEGGISLFTTSEQHIGLYGNAEDIADDTGVIIGWQSDYHPPVHFIPSRAFIFDNENGLRFLSDLYPAVAELEADGRGTLGWRIQNNGDMIIYRGNGPGVYRLTPTGVLTEETFPDCAGFANDQGEYPPPGVRAEDGFCSVSNLLQGTGGSHVGHLVQMESDGTYTIRYHRDGTALPGGTFANLGVGLVGSYSVNSINSTGFVSGYPGFLWSPEDKFVDIRESVLTQCSPDDFEFGAPHPNGQGDLFVNDQNWLQWANLVMRPACPDVSIAVTGTGFSFESGKPSVNLGARFTLTTTVTNDGRVTLESMLVSPDPKTPRFFRAVSAANPPFPDSLEAGASFSSTTEYEAIATGEFVGSITVAGAGNCGDYAYVQPPGTIVVLGEEKVFVVNETGDEVDASATDGRCDIDDDGTEANCTLRAAIEESKRVTSGLARIHFNIPGGSPVIAPASALPAITRAVVIDATTQAGGVVTLSGASVGSVEGLLVSGASDVVVRGLTITGFGTWGIRFNGGVGHKVEASNIGFQPNDGAPAPNTGGGILVAGGASDVTIGGDTEELQNRIYGGVVVEGGTAQGVRMLRNELEVEPVRLAAGTTRTPFDIGIDGPTCAPWTDAGGLMPPPRLFSISTTKVTGTTRPGATVILYEVIASGTERGRYWGRHVKPVGIATADGTGAFSADISLSVGAFVTAAAVDASGNSSELAQVRRPVIFAPGIGGSWIKDANNLALWIPVGLPDGVANDRLSRLRMNVDGTSAEPTTVDGTLDQIALPYRAISLAIEGAGFPGDRGNTNRATNDYWRFAYDWRRSAYDVATDLHAFIDNITGGASDVAFSCEVDLMAHSNGGVVSNVYILRDAAHASEHVHRYLTIATPYLGAVAAARGHIKGDVFGVDEALGYKIEWGKMITMVRNMPGAYGLLPSRKYWYAVNLESPSHRHGFLLQDLSGKSLKSFDATARFFEQPKVDPVTGKPLGLERNAAIWTEQDERVHTLIDDWTDWAGPPQIFRQVGVVAGSTVTGYRLGEPPASNAEGNFVETGDTPTHIDWRERMHPIYGFGDGTVPLASATLGADREVGVGRTDFSGVDSPWIEPFEYYPCTHTGIVDSKCPGLPGQLPALERVIEILRSGYEVLGATAGKAPARLTLPGRELVYVSGTGPLAVWVEDANGYRTGPASLDALDDIVYDLPTMGFKPAESGRNEIGYWPSERSVTLSLPTDSLYTVTVQAAEAGEVRMTRVRVDGADESRRTVLFEDQPMEAGGALRIDFAVADTPETVPLALDADGDGSFEGELAPAVGIDAATGAPAIPLPSPSAVFTQALAGEAVEVGLVFPDLGGPIWGWTLAETADWIEPSATFGTTPGIVTLTLTRATGNEAVQTAVVDLVLTYEGYSLSLPVPVELRTGVSTAEEPEVVLPTAVSLEQNFPNPFAQTTRLAFSLPQAMPVTLTVFDVLGREVAVLVDGVLSAGVHELETRAAGLPSGVYLYRLTTPEVETTRRMTIVK